jgi:RNA polymerase sigma factor (sigma-70 family)
MLRRLSDAQLLSRFVADRHSDAFEILVARHGPRVLGICRKVLGRTPEVDDAFQSTFLLLARKAGSIRKRASLGSWLHGVAHRVAVRSRARSARRITFESRVAQLPRDHREIDLDVQDIQRILHEEIDRLPAHYRQPILLCYLDEQTNEAAARHLGCPTSTLKDRLARAREILRGRLARRGVALTALLLLLLLPGGVSAESVPPRLLATTLRAARPVIERPLKLPWLASRTSNFRPAAVIATSTVLVGLVVIAGFVLPRPPHGSWLYWLIEAARRACR